MKSQGIIHGGAKYALHGALTGASEAIADMPRRWRACLGSDGELDLRGVRLLSEAHYLWSPGGLAGSLTSFFASKAVRSRVEQAKGEDLPPALRDKGFKGKAYRLTEIVFDVPDLIRRLAELAGDSLLAGERIEPLREGRELAGLCVDGREIRAQRVVLSAGAGNEALLRELGLEQPAMQRRPLHMVMVKAATLKPLYAHCLGAGPKPRITVTTHPTRDASRSGTSAATSPKPMAWPATKPRRSPKHAANWQSCCPGSTSARRSGPPCGWIAPSRHSPTCCARTTPSSPNRDACWSAGRPSWRWPLTSPTGSAPAWKKTASAPANMPRCRNCRVRRSPNRPGR